MLNIEENEKYDVFGFGYILLQLTEVYFCSCSYTLSSNPILWTSPLGITY